MKTGKKLLALITVICMLLTALPLSAGAKTTGTEYRINPSVTEGDINKFTYSNGTTSWVVSDSEAYSDVYTDTQNPESVFAEFTFVGNRIEVYGAKSPLHGIVKFYYDGNLVQTYDAYNATRQENQQMLAYGTASGEDAQHTVKIVATGTANSAVQDKRAVIQFSYVKIWHNDYSLMDFTLPENMDIFEGQTKTVNPLTTVPDYATLEGASFEIADTTIATVSENGRVTGVKAGSTTLTVTANNVTQTMKINVLEPVPALHGSIGDTNVHYTQDKYDDVLDMSKTSENLTAWKGDKALSQIALISENSAINNVTLSASDFKSGGKKIDASEVKLYFIDETLAYVGMQGYHSANLGPANTPKGTESYPDILNDVASENIAFNSVKNIWVEINVPKGTSAGTYTGTITVSADDVEPLEFNYSLEVQNETLPDAQDYDFDVELWQYPYSVAEYYDLEPFSEEHIEVLSRHMAQYRDIGGHAITCSIVDDAWDGQTYSANSIRYPSMVEWRKKADGTFTYDYSDFDAWVKLNKDLGIGDKIVLYSIASWSGKIRYYDEATSAYITTTPTLYSEEWQKMWRDFLEKMVDHLEEKGWFNDTYMGIDERGFNAAPFNLIESVHADNGESLKTVGAFDSITDSTKVSLSDRIDVLSIGSAAVKSHNNEFKTLLARRNAQGQETTIYTCTGHFPSTFTYSMPGEGYWIPFFAAAQGASGYMKWSYDAWVADPLKDTSHWAFESGDCFFVYPGDEANGYTTRSSIRLAKLCEGIRDINKLKYMQAQQPALASSINELYATINNAYSSITRNGSSYASDETKAQLPIDMAALKEGVNNITRQYISIKMLHPSIPMYDYPSSKQILVDREAGQYLGQPDLVMLDDEQTIVTVYPKNHGLGATQLKRSTDGGLTWSERATNTPVSWLDSQETPTIYKLDFKDGSQKLIMISGCPGWGNGTTGFNTSISTDGGLTWSEYNHFYDGTKTIVPMASLVHIKDENGEYMDKWMGVFHNYDYINYKTYLTFDENGVEHWSTPEPYLSEWRSIESSHQICEVGMFRSPDGKRIVALARSQSHMHPATMFYSDDEGETWSCPRDLPASLLGERHKAVYDPISGRLFITFREILLDVDNDNQIENNDWLAGDWLAWVGTYDDLMSGNEGQYRIRLAEDFTPTAKSGDTGYAGLCVTSDGTIFTNSYGNFDSADQSNKPYIIGVRFKLSEIDEALGIAPAVDVSALRDKISEAREALDGNDYSASALEALNSAIETYTGYLESLNKTQKEIDEAVADLDRLINSSAVIKWGNVNNDNEVNASDATMVLQHFAKIIDENTEGYYASLADVDGNEEINASDATLILQKFAKIITSFPVE